MKELRLDPSAGGDFSNSMDNREKEEESKPNGMRAMLKIPPEKSNNSNFQSVPREFYIQQNEIHASKLPAVGDYRPRFDYTEAKVKGKIKYGTKA